MDAFSAMERSFVKLPNHFYRGVFSQGQVTNQGETMECFPSDRQPQPWTLGSNINNRIRNVRFFSSLHFLKLLKFCLFSVRQERFAGLTGHVAFDERGQRKNYTLDIMGMALNSPPEPVIISQGYISSPISFPTLIS